MVTAVTVTGKEDMNSPYFTLQQSNERLFYAKLVKSGSVLLYFDYICKRIIKTTYIYDTRICKDISRNA